MIDVNRFSDLCHKRENKDRSFSFNQTLVNSLEEKTKKSNKIFDKSTLSILQRGVYKSCSFSFNGNNHEITKSDRLDNMELMSSVQMKQEYYLTKLNTISSNLNGYCAITCLCSALFDNLLQFNGKILNLSNSWEETVNKNKMAKYITVDLLLLSPIPRKILSVGQHKIPLFNLDSIINTSFSLWHNNKKSKAF